jgi:hypothetical protein
MTIYTRRIIFLCFAFALVACSGAGQTATTPSGDTRASVSQSSDSGQLIFKKMKVNPDAGAPPLIMSFIANGPNQGGVPCIDCVYGATSGDNVGMTGPSSYVVSNSYWQYDISFTDISYKGKCKVLWTIVSPSKKNIDTFSASFTLTSSGGFVLYAIARARPSYSGAATVTGKYECGKNTGSTQEPLYFE